MSDMRYREITHQQLQQGYVRRIPRTDGFGSIARLEYRHYIVVGKTPSGNYLVIDPDYWLDKEDGYKPANVGDEPLEG